MIGTLLTYLLTYGGAGFAVFNPFVGVCIFWAFDIVRPQYMFAWTGLQGDFSQVVAIGTIVGWALRGFGSWNLGRGKTIYGLYVAYGVWVVLSAVSASNQDVAWAFVIEQTKRTLMFTIAVTTADSVRRMEQLAWIITGSGGLVAYELNMRYLGGNNEAQRLGWAGMDNNCLAILMVTCLGVSMFLGLHSRPLWKKSLAFVSSALVAHTVLLTFSRGGMLGMLLAGAVALVLLPKRSHYLAVAAAAGLLLLSLTGPEVRARFMTSFEDERDYSAQSRVELWRDCIQVMRAHPIFGVGPHHFPLIADQFGWPAGKEAHTLWLQLGAEVGIPGMLLLLSTYLTAMRRLWPIARQPDDGHGPWLPHASGMVVTSLAGFILSAQFVSLEGLEAPLYVTAIGVAALRHSSAPALQSVNPRVPLRRPVDPRFGSGAILPPARWVHPRG